MHDALTTEITGLDAEVKKAAKGNAIVKQLKTMPGVGIFGALFLQAEIGAIKRVHTAASARRAIGGSNGSSWQSS